MDHFYEEIYFEYFRPHVRYDGQILWSFGGAFQTSCNLVVTTYPFDYQRCQIIIENWAYHKDTVELLNGSATVMMDNFIPNGIWDTVSTSVEQADIVYGTSPNIKYPQVKFTFTWRRKPLYYIVNVMVPCLFLLSIALLVFWLPPDAGEKVSLGVTILLAFSVFQFVIADNTPENSDNTPLLSL